MIYTKSNPIGLDTKLNAIQTKIHNALIAFGLLTGDIDLYGRTYKHKDGSELVPAKYDSVVNRALFDNSKILVGYFYERTDGTNTNGMMNVMIGNTFHVNLPKMYPLITHRADKEFEKFISSIYNLEPYGFRLMNISNNPFSDFNYDTTVEEFPPFYSVRFDLNINYRI